MSVLYLGMKFIFGSEIININEMKIKNGDVNTGETFAWVKMETQIININDFNSRSDYFLLLTHFHS
jgi:hypothetical protein